MLFSHDLGTWFCKNGIMFLAVFFVPLFIFAYADVKGPFCFKDKSGEVTDFPVEYNFKLRDEQCLGKLYTAPDQECSLHNTKGVSVKVCDQNGEPSVSFSNFREYSYFEGRHYANITRFSPHALCPSEANVTLTIYCGVPAGTYFLPRPMVKHVRSLTQNSYK